MKALRISTALSLLIITAVAPQVLAAGDPNLDSGVGSASSRGPYGFNNTNNGNIYETPANDYGVWRDAYGGLRDRGMIPDNLTTRVPEPTWEDTHPAGPPHVMGAPGGLAGGLMGGIGGIGGFGGFGLGAFSSLAGGFGASTNLIGTPLSAVFGSAANHGIPTTVNGIGPFGGAPRTANNFVGAPGTFFNDHPFTGTRYLGPGSGFLPFSNVTTTQETANGQTVTTTNWQSSMGPAQMVTVTNGTGSNQTSSSTFTFNGNQYYFNSQNQPIASGSGTGTGTGTGPSTLPNNTTQTTITQSNNGFTSPWLPNTPNSVTDPNYFTHGQSGSLGSGFATPATSGNQRSIFFNNQQATGGIGGSFAGPGSSGSQRDVYYSNNLGSSTIGGGFATPQTSGSERSTAYPNININNQMGTGYGGITGQTGMSGYDPFGFNGFSPFGFSGIGPFGLNPFAGYGGFPTGLNYSGAPYVGSPNVGWQNENQGEENGNDKSNGSIARSAGANTFMNGQGNASLSQFNNNSTGGRTTYGPTSNAASGIFGEIPQGLPAGAPMGTMGERGAAPLPAMPGIGNMSSGSGRIKRTSANNPGNGGCRTQARTRVRTHVATHHTLPRLIAQGSGTSTTGGDGAFGFFGGSLGLLAGMNAGLSYGAPFLGATPIPPTGWYGAGRVLRTHFDVQSITAAGNGLQGNTTTDMEGKLAQLNLTPHQMLGKVIQSIRLDNGDIVTYGTAGRLHLATDNSGSITFNNGEILTFKQVPPALRAIALRSTLLF